MGRVRAAEVTPEVMVCITTASGTAMGTSAGHLCAQEHGLLALRDVVSGDWNTFFPFKISVSDFPGVANPRSAGHCECIRTAASSPGSCAAAVWGAARRLAGRPNTAATVERRREMGMVREDLAERCRLERAQGLLPAELSARHARHCR